MPEINDTCTNPVISQVLDEQHQTHQTRKKLFIELERRLEKQVVTYFTSFVEPVSMDDSDVDMLEGILQKLDLTRGLALVISSPGGSGLAAERIVNVCRKYSKTGEYTAIVPGKAKSAATMACFGASKIMMGPSSELGPVDPQLPRKNKDGVVQWFSAHNVVDSYTDLFSRAIKEKGNLQPYLQQLANYDEREIRELNSAILLSEDISIRTLALGMMQDISEAEIKKKIKIFLRPEDTKSHGRPIYGIKAKECGLNVDILGIDDAVWQLLYELYLRTNNFVSTKALKCIESEIHSFAVYKRT